MTRSKGGKVKIWGYPLQAKSDHQVKWFLAIQEGSDGGIDGLYPTFHSELVPVPNVEV